MCRITGYRTFNTPPDDAESLLCRMRDTLSEGGPDDAGVYLDLRGQLGLAHRRLSILDLSPLGHQPMETDRFVITYNGEIYNFQEVRAELEAEGLTFSTHSDTEVLLKGFAYWGQAVIFRCRGMFAFAVWDKLTHSLTLCRDRVGVKPLFWSYQNGLFLFGSELKALMQHPEFDKTLNLDVLPGYFKVGYIQGPASIFKQVRKLEPGCFLTLDAQGEVQIDRYWDPKVAYNQPRYQFNSYEEAREAALPLLKESFGLRMVSDVPAGVFLSSGIDSSLVASILSETQTLQTFTIGFEDPSYNEAALAKKIAAHLGARHTEYYCTESDFLELVPQIPHRYDEPFGGSSSIPTTLVSKIAKTQVSVALSADGGDELFGGYTKYQAGILFFPKLQAVSRPIRRWIQAGLRPIDPESLERVIGSLPYVNRFANIKDKFAKFRDAFDSANLAEFFRKSSEYMADSEVNALLGRPGTISVLDLGIVPRPGYAVSYMGLIDMLTYLPGDILTKVDRATMGVALEGREPFLDHHLIEFSLCLPDDYKFRAGQNKAILRDILRDYLPAELIDTVKRGFGIPVYRWLKGPLKPQLIALQNDREFFALFGLSAEFASTLLTDFLESRRFVSAHLVWFLFQLWEWKNTWLSR